MEFVGDDRGDRRGALGFRDLGDRVTPVISEIFFRGELERFGEEFLGDMDGTGFSRFTRRLRLSANLDISLRS